MNKLKKLHNKFDEVSLLMESIEDKINDCIENNTSTSKFDYKLEKLENKQYKIQCKIEQLKRKN